MKHNYIHTMLGLPAATDIAAGYIAHQCGCGMWMWYAISPTPINAMNCKPTARLDERNARSPLAMR